MYKNLNTFFLILKQIILRKDALDIKNLLMWKRDY